MVLAGGDGHDAHGQQRRNRLGRAVRGAAVLAVAERALLPEAPAEHRAARAQGEAVVLPARHRHHGVGGRVQPLLDRLQRAQACLRAVPQLATPPGAAREDLARIGHGERARGPGRRRHEAPLRPLRVLAIHGRWRNGGLHMQAEHVVLVLVRRDLAPAAASEQPTRGTVDKDRVRSARTEHCGGPEAGAAHGLDE